MAKVGRPLNSEKARGAIGGLVFSESNNVNYVRKNTKPKYQQTQKRKEQAAQLAEIASVWANLQSTEKAYWVDFAEKTIKHNEFGDKYTIPAFSWFVSCYQNLTAIKMIPAMQPYPLIRPNSTSEQFPSAPIFDHIDVRIQQRRYIVSIYYKEGINSAVRYRLYWGKRQSPGQTLNISECAIITPTGYIPNGVNYSGNATYMKPFEGDWTIYTQAIRNYSGLASDFTRTNISISFT